MDGKQNNLDSHESGDSLTQELGGAINYSETMEELPMDAAKNRERGELVNDAVVNSFKGAKERSESIDPFWQSHPELFEEAKRMGAPLEVGEFKKEGFVFGEDADGKKHIWATTPEYRKWQEGGKEGRQPRHYESLEDQEYRKWREEYFAKLKNQLRADKEYNQKVAERKDGLEKLINEKKAGIFSKETVDYVYDTLYPDGIRGARDEVVKKRILGGLEGAEKNMLDNASYKVESLYRNAYSEAFRNDTAQIPDQTDGIKKIKSSLAIDFIYPGNQKFKNAAERVAKPLLEIYKREKLPDISVEAPSDEKIQEIKTDAAEIDISKGKFFPNTFKDSPNAMDDIMAEIGIDKKDNEVIKAALFGYGDRSDGAEIDYFDLKNEVAKRIYDEYGNIYPSDDKNRLVFNDYYDGEITLSPEVSSKAVEEIKAATGKLTEQISNDAKVGELAKKTLEETAKRERQKLAETVYRAYDLDFSHYLSIEKIGIPSSGFLDDYINSLIKEAGATPLRRFIDKETILSAAPSVNIEVASNYESILHDGLLERLRYGVEGAYGREQYLTDIFTTESFLENQERLGIDFSDPEIFEPAFDGFISTLKSRSGEHREQADWYYEAIFANDPGRFLAMVKAFKDTSDDIGAKRKITKFFENNEQAFNDKIKQEVEESFAKEINGEHKVIRTSVLKNAERKDIKNIIDEYKKDIIERVREKGGEEIDTFTGARTLSGERQETGTKERKETPFDFSIEKANALLRYSDFIENNIPDANVRWFTDTFVKNGKVSDIFKRDDSYIGFSFEYEGNLCVIAESLDEEAAMYLWRGEPGGDFKEMFDLSKYDAKRTDDPRIVSVDHLDKEHFDESLDLSYKKALLFFRTGNKRLVNYSYFGNNPARAKRDWNEYQELEYPAWPLGIDGYVTESEDLEQYNAWHERQDEIQARLKEAVERGGQEELESERKRIAQEEYDRVMNETM